MLLLQLPPTVKSVSEKAIHNKRCGILTAGLVLLHNNALPHTAPRWTHLLEEFNWDVFNHPPYSSDLALSDFHLFLHLKKFLFGQSRHFQNDRQRWVSHSGSNPGGSPLRYGDTKVGPTAWRMSQFRRWICWTLYYSCLTQNINMQVVLWGKKSC